MAENPDVTELIKYNKAACEHARQSQHTRWLGGTAGRIGGQHPETWWYCNDCKEWLRPTKWLLDSEEGRALAAKLEAMRPVETKGGPG